MTTTSSNTSAMGGNTAPNAIAGLHHVTGITANMQANVDFYTGVLGLRLVKMTINYDDPGSHHVYYGDGLGRPGTILTFFGWPNARRGFPGTGQVIETAYNIPTGSAGYWQARLTERKVTNELVTRFGSAVLTFRDPDGLPLALVESPEAAHQTQHAWRHADVPVEHAIRAFHSVTVAEPHEDVVTPVLVDRFGYREAAREGKRVRYQSNADTAGRTVDVLVRPGSPARMGAGEIHHVAFRTPDDAQQGQWLQTLRTDGYGVSPVMNRDYFHSIYFREPGGTLFEIATDSPGMTINETPEELGTRIMLPSWLEPQRAEVEAILPKVTLASRVEGVSAEEGVQ